MQNLTIEGPMIIYSANYRREVCLYEGEATSRSTYYQDIGGGREDKRGDHHP